MSEAAVPRRTIDRALVVGGAGFLGLCTVEALGRGATTVVSVDRDPRGRLDRLGVESVQADVAALDRALRALLEHTSFDCVICLVGTGSVPRSLEHPRGDLDANTVSVLTVLEVLRDLEDPPVFVHTSSAAVYGESRYLPMDERHPLEPVSPYGISKLAAERYVGLYAATFGVPAFSVRPFSVYGPGQRKLVVYDLLRRLRDGEDPLVVDAPGDVSRDLVFGPDVGRAIATLATTAPATGEAYNLSSGAGTTLEALVSTLVEASGTHADWSFTGRRRPGDPQRWEGDPTRAQALGAGCHTPLADGLAQTVAWFDATR